MDGPGTAVGGGRALDLQAAPVVGTEVSPPPNLYGEHAAAVLVLAARLVPEAGDVADVVAEVFATARRPADAVAARPHASARSRLCELTVEVTQRRRLSLRRRRWTDDAAAAEVARMVTLARGEDHGRAHRWQAFAALDEGDRQVLALASWAGLDWDEVARIAGRRRLAARMRHRRAGRRYRDALGLPAGVSRDVVGPDPVDAVALESSWEGSAAVGGVWSTVASGACDRPVRRLESLEGGAAPHDTEGEPRQHGFGCGVYHL